MSDIAATHSGKAQSAIHAPFRMDGPVAARRPCSGLETLFTRSADDRSAGRRDLADHAEASRTGDWRHGLQTMDGGRLVHVQDPAPSTSLSAGHPTSKGRSLTRDEFIAEYCRRRNVAWEDIAAYRVAVPSNDTSGWTMASMECHEDEQTVQGPLEPLA